jgi:hypothetical protein
MCKALAQPLDGSKHSGIVHSYQDPPYDKAAVNILVPKNASRFRILCLGTHPRDGIHGPMLQTGNFLPNSLHPSTLLLAVCRAPLLARAPGLDLSQGSSPPHHVRGVVKGAGQ